MDIWSLSRFNVGGGMRKYALLGIILGLAIIGAYYSGYSAGKSNTTIEYITQEKEVIKYVAKEKAIIQSKPNAGRNELIGLYASNKL